MNKHLWLDDARLHKAQAHARRGEVLQAELLLRNLLAEHPSCVPALDGLASLTAQREDWTQAIEFLRRAAVLEPTASVWHFRAAQALAASNQLDEALASLRSLLRLDRDHEPAQLLKADILEAKGDNLGALRARYRVVTRAQSQGRWHGVADTEPALLHAVARHIDRLWNDRRDFLHGSYQRVRDAHGADSVKRVDAALAGYLGEIDDTPPDPRQRPKFLYFPDLPPGPYHDPYLHPWASTLRDACDLLREEALDLLEQDRDFVSFLGLQPGESAPQYVGGDNPQASWDAFFFYRHGKRFDDNHVRCPQSGRVIDSLDLCRVNHQAPEVCFSVIRPRSTIMPHYGVTNTRLVMHLPLVVPPHCALNIVGAGPHEWRVGELMMFDDTFQHEAWNKSDQPRLILLMDCWNPHLSPVEREAVKHLVEAIDNVENDHELA